jgi:H+/Cl- antiporter ClcA
MGMNMKIFTTIIFFIVAIIIIVHMNKTFFDIYDVVQMNTKQNLTNYSKYIFIYVPIMFFIASKAKHFELSDGYFQLYIEKMVESVNNHAKSYSKTSYFVGGLSNIAIYIFSLLAIASGAAVGDEGVIIYSSICLMLYFYFKSKKVLGLKDIYTELIIYLGYAIGFTITYGSMISTFFYILEHMVINKDINFFSNFGVMVCAIPFIYYLVGEKNNLIKIDKLSFNFENFGYIVLFSVIMGTLSFGFFRSINVMFNYIITSKFNNLYVILFGFLVAFIVKKLGFFTMGVGESAINEGFQAVINNEKLKQLEKEQKYDELDKLKKLEKEGKFNTTNRFTINRVLGRMVNTNVSIGAGLTGGLVIPSMTIGCGVGSVLSEYIPIPQQNLMYLGMSAFLSPFLDAPITSALVINRICNQTYDTLPLSLCVSFISYFTYTFLKKKLHH